MLHKKALTLIELVIYVAIAGVALVSIVSFGWRTLETQGKVNRATELLQNGRLALHRISQFVKEADNIVPEVGADPTRFTLQSVSDARIHQNTPRQNYGGNRDLHVYPWAPSYSQRGLVQFDLSSLPQRASVSQATLRLKEWNTYGFNRAIALHRVNRAWTERGVTWNSTGNTRWTIPGGDYETAPTSVTNVIYNPSTFPAMDSWDVTADLRAFLAGTASNYGWLLKDQIEDNSQRYWMFHTRENTSPPELVIELNAQGSLFNVHPGALALDFPGTSEDMMIDTYMSPNQHRKLRLRKGANAPLDLTSDDVDVTEFLITNLTPQGNSPIVQIHLTLTQGDETLDLQTSAALRRY